MRHSFFIILAFCLTLVGITWKDVLPIEPGNSHGPTALDHAQVRPRPVGLSCQQVIAIAREAIREALRKEKDPLPVTWMDDDPVWAIETDPDDLDKWRVSWGGNPAGGGYHGHAVIDKATGKVETVHIGRHLR